MDFFWRGGGALSIDSLECDICNEWYLWNYGGLENFPYSWVLPIWDSALESTRVYWRKRLFKVDDETARDPRQLRDIEPHKAAE